ncbi:unnamed protein product [Phytophthora fragariaefolia]|uniref:Unnamed protein product n=1 Tax=Phytophthora fragariaefolia TaxID=1490495 RepID=A0A9W6Y020_9STRA|nr:unnamed protein product [Phytophthora fragariaefolia]
MDYRPILLLQTSYKVFAKVLATRIQTFMDHVIGDTQQGFVHGRQMQKAVVMMLAQLQTAQSEHDLPANLSRIIPLLDFKKAYDTVDREFLLTTLRLFGFSESFARLVQRLHDGTSARFSVDGRLSKLMPIQSGIRQGCPLAPLPFILAAEILGLAVQQDSQLQGLPVPGQPETIHTFSAFVDDSTIFLRFAHQIKPVLDLVKRFGQLSGLHVQPQKSQIIFLNSGYPQQLRGNSGGRPQRDNQVLGVPIRDSNLINVNWALRIRNVQRRLLTATTVATSVANRILVLNTIILPAILFTAIAFEIPPWASKELHILYKNFLWRQKTEISSGRHRINPSLLYAP